MANGRQVLQADAAINRLAVTLAAIDSYSMAARREPYGKLFREGFESAVAGRNSTRTEDGNAHLPGILNPRERHDVLAACERETRAGAFFGARTLTGLYLNQLAMYS